MRTGRPTPSVVLTAEERETLDQWARRPTTALALAQRARIVLASTTDQTNGHIAEDIGVTRQTVASVAMLWGMLKHPGSGAA
jgi:predicted transcriptional regulator